MNIKKYEIEQTTEGSERIVIKKWLIFLYKFILKLLKIYNL